MLFYLFNIILAIDRRKREFLHCSKQFKNTLKEYFRTQMDKDKVSTWFYFEQIRIDLFRCLCLQNRFMLRLSSCSGPYVKMSVLFFRSYLSYRRRMAPRIVLISGG